MIADVSTKQLPSSVADPKIRSCPFICTTRTTAAGGIRVRELVELDDRYIANLRKQEQEKGKNKRKM